MQIDSVVVKAHYRLSCTRQKFVFRIHTRAAVDQLDVKSFILEVAEFFRQHCRKVNLLFHAADDHRQLFGMGRACANYHRAADNGRAKQMAT
jgi:hypothetical protein